MLAACFTRDTVPQEFGGLLDWRHFFVAEGVGKSIYGIARKAAAEYLRFVGTAVNFLMPKWHDSLKNAAHNLSILGCFTEQMLLSWISLNGCKVAGDVFSTRPTSIHFSSPGIPIPSHDLALKAQCLRSNGHRDRAFSLLFVNTSHARHVDNFR